MPHRKRSIKILCATIIITMKFLDFNATIINRSETDFFSEATKIARRYAYYFSSKKNVTIDWEFIADGAVLRTLEIIKRTKWAESPNFYFACLKKNCLWGVSSSSLQQEKIISLEQLTTDEQGRNRSDRFCFNPLNQERTYTEEIELNAVHRIMDLADEFMPEKEVEKTLGIEHLTFLTLVKKYKIQFHTGSTRMLLDFLRVYNFYKDCGNDISLTRQAFKNSELPYSVKICIKMAEHYINLFHENREIFFNRFVLPPNSSPKYEKIG